MSTRRISYYPILAQLSVLGLLSVYFFLVFFATAGAQPQSVPGVGGVSLQNPLRATSITALLEGIVAIVLVLAIPILVLFTIYAGFLYVTARGNPQKVTEAHRALGSALLGGVLILGAYAIAAIIGNIVRSFQASP